MSASADVLAMAKVEVDLATIPEGKNVSVSTPGEANAARGYNEGVFLTNSIVGHHQVARKARLHPTPNPLGD